MERVTEYRDLFFQARDPDAFVRQYVANLGIEPVPAEDERGGLPARAGGFQTGLGRPGTILSYGLRADVVIQTPDQRLRVFVSSTLGELAEERRVVARAVSALRLTPVLFELGARPHPPHDLYRAYLAQSDVFVGLYWQRYGRVGPGMEVSGLEEEFQLARAGALPRLLYVKTPAPDREPRLDELLARVKQEASYRRFRTPGELGRVVREDLATLLSERFAAARTVAADPGSPPASSGTPRGARTLPVARTSLVGREQAIDEVAGLLAPPEARLVTLTGPGGIGKTRLALAVGERLRDRFGDFALTDRDAWAVVELCRRLEGVPLAIELAAARTRLLEPDALLGRLSRSLDALGTGAVDLPERQHTLRATVEWSVGLLEDTQRSLLETLAVFVDGWTIEAAAQVARLEEDQALEVSEALARHSLIQLDRTEFGSRSRMLETVRAFLAERLAARPDVAAIGRRHADHYRALATQADRPLRGLDQDHWAEGLELEAGNLAAAVRWYLAHDRAPLPHLFRVLWMYWELGDHMGEANVWIEQLLPAADSLDPQARAELLWAALVAATEVGDDAAALATSQRLASLLAGIQDPYLHVVSQLAMAWTSPILGDVDGALRGALVSLEQLRGQDEPYWTTVAVLTAGLVETAMGRHDAALGHLREARDLAERFDHAGLSAWSQVQLGILALVRGRLEEARALLDEGLELSLATRSTRNVGLCLTAFAQLAFVEGDGERAALLAGAVESLRRRVGLRAWPLQRQGGGPDGGPDPAGDGRGPVRPGVRRRCPAQSPGGSSGRPRPARRRHRSLLSRS